MLHLLGQVSQPQTAAMPALVLLRAVHGWWVHLLSLLSRSSRKKSNLCSNFINQSLNEHRENHHHLKPSHPIFRIFKSEQKSCHFPRNIFFAHLSLSALGGCVINFPQLFAPSPRLNISERMLKKNKYFHLYRSKRRATIWDEIGREKLLYIIFFTFFSTSTAAVCICRWGQWETHRQNEFSSLITCENPRLKS